MKLENIAKHENLINGARALRDKITAADAAVRILSAGEVVLARIQVFENSANASIETREISDWFAKCLLDAAEHELQRLKAAFEALPDAFKD